jgi:uncharacterized protein
MLLTNSRNSFNKAVIRKLIFDICTIIKNWPTVMVKVSRLIQGVFMINPFQQHGAFSWCELMTTNLKEAEAFYVKLFGWTVTDGPVEGMEYRVMSAGGQAIGGMMAIPSDMQPMPPHWGTTVTVEDLDVTTKMAEDLGGKVLMQPQAIPTVGRFAIIQDPQGAVITVITYSRSS